MKSFICLCVACFFPMVWHSPVPGLQCCIAVRFSVPSGCFLVNLNFFIYRHILVPSVCMYFIQVFEMNSSLLPFSNLFAKLKQDMGPEWIFCFSWNKKSCCRGIGFLCCSSCGQALRGLRFGAYDPVETYPVFNLSNGVWIKDLSLFVLPF